MAVWKSVLYVTLALAILVLILLLNFAYLPNRRLHQELNASTYSSSAGNRPTISSVTTSKSTRFTPKFDDEELSLEDYKTRTWNCSINPNITTNLKQTVENRSFSLCYNERKDPLLCFLDPVHCKHPWSSVRLYKRHDIHWPRYGEYTYLPRSKWPYIIVNGGVLFLYHPCASPGLIARLKVIAGSCLRRHVITPYENLDPEKDFAIVTWGCVLSAKELNLTAVKQWIRDNAMKAPANHVTKTGDFNKGLLQPAQIVSDIHETQLCPSNEFEFASSKSTQYQDDSDSEQMDNIRNGQHVEEHLSIKASENFIIVRGRDGKRRQRHKFNSVNAAWALGSLVFLGAILVSVMVYTKPWKQRDYWWRNDDLTCSSNAKFNLLKSKRFNLNWKRGNKKKSSAHARLLGPIPEECDDEI